MPSFAPEYDKLFAFGIDPVDGGLPADEPRDWPRLDEVAKYGARLRETLDARLADFEIENNQARRNELTQLLHVAIEHRLMHAETLAYMLHQLAADRKSCAGGAPILSAAPAYIFSKGGTAHGCDSSRERDFGTAAQ